MHLIDSNYDDTPKNAKEIANELGIELVLRQNTSRAVDL